MKAFLLSPDPPEPASSGGSPDPDAPAASGAHDPTQTDPPEPSRPGAQADPPAARTVLDGDIDEEAARLKARLSKTERALKERETRICELEDENHRLKAVTPQSGQPVKRPFTVLDWE